jgi:hypothetical protein
MTNIHFWSYLAQFFLEWDFADEVVEKIKMHISCSVTFFRKSCRLRDNVENYGIAWQATDDNIAHAHCCCISKAINTLRICNTYYYFIAKILGVRAGGIQNTGCPGWRYTQLTACNMRTIQYIYCKVNAQLIENLRIWLSPLQSHCCVVSHACAEMAWEERSHQSSFRSYCLAP